MTKLAIARLLAPLLVLFALATPALAEKSCHYQSGVKRWTIKTSVRGDQNARAKSVDLASLLKTPNPTLDKKTLQQMRKMRLAHSFDFQSGGHTVSIQEGDKIRVTGYVISTACDTDGDVHHRRRIGRTSKCLIVEIPDPDQIHDPRLKSLINPARAIVLGYLNTSPPHGEITVDGQLFRYPST